MSGNLNPNPKLKKTNINIVFRDINISKSNSDPIPILLIFCFFVFLVFVFAIIATLLLWVLRDRKIEETGDLTLQDFNFLVESIEFFEEQNQESISLLNESHLSLPLSDNLSFGFRDLAIVPHRHLAELTNHLAKMRDESKVDNFTPGKSRDYEINSLDELLLNIPDSPVILDRNASLQGSADRTMTLQEFFQSSRPHNESNISSEFTRFSALANLPKNTAAKNSDESDLLEIQLPENIDEFSTQIAIANLPDRSFFSPWEKPPKKVPEPANGLSAIVIFICMIFLISRQKK